QFEHGQPVEALQRLHQLVSENAEDLRSWQLGGRIALGRPDFLEFACDWTGEAIKRFPENPLIVCQCAEALLLSQQVEPALALWPRGSASHHPAPVAGRVMCELVAHEPVGGIASEEGAVSRAFIELYRRLLAVEAGAVIGKVNAR